MPLSTLSSADLSKLIQLVKDKELLEAKLSQVRSAIDGLASGQTAKGNKSPKRQTRRKRRRSSLKVSILKALQVSGKEGLNVKELATNLKANPGSVSVWFYTTGKKVKGIKKIGPGRFALAN
jgi:hypothetical protein